jgi:hypothetical protein
MVMQEMHGGAAAKEAVVLVLQVWGSDPLESLPHLPAAAEEQPTNNGGPQAKFSIIAHLQGRELAETRVLPMAQAERTLPESASYGAGAEPRTCLLSQWPPAGGWSVAGEAGEDEDHDLTKGLALISVGEQRVVAHYSNKCCLQMHVLGRQGTTGSCI